MSDLRVLDIATFIAAPFSATMLSEFGAEVIKIEEPSKGDSLRHLAEREDGEGLWWIQEARNKRTITCDLRTPEGQKLFLGLVEKADVVVENFRPGTLEEWGLDYKSLAEVNPAIILLRISGYGQTGPYARKPGFGRIAQAFAGLTHLTGIPGGPPLNPGSATIADYVAGLFGAYAVLVAKAHRDRTGQGQEIDISLYESMFRILDSLGIVYDRQNLVRQRSGSDAPHAAPHNHYPTLDGKWVAIACSNDRLFYRLTQAMQQPELTEDSRFSDMPSRVRHRTEIDGIVTAYTRSLASGELIANLETHEVPASMINSIVDIFSDPHVLERGTLVPAQHDRLGTFKVPGIVPYMSKSPGKIRHLGRALGQDTDDVYAEYLGLQANEIINLRRKGVI